MKKRHHAPIESEDPMMPMATLINPNGLDEVSTETAILAKLPKGFEIGYRYSSAVDDTTLEQEPGSVTEMHIIPTDEQLVRTAQNGPMEYAFKLGIGTTKN